MLVLYILGLLICGLIVLAHLAMYTGLFRSARLARPVNGADKSATPFATVVVPARNEELLLPRLLESLKQQTSSDFSIVLVDDRSSDSTLEKMKNFARANPGQVDVVSLTTPPSIANPKLNALIQGVEKANGEVLLFTDADCMVPETWVEQVVHSFSNSALGVALGPIETRKDSSLLSVFHAFDHIFKYSYTAGCAGIGMPTGGFGNNLAIRKEALDAVGGLSAIQVTSTEDAALISEIRAKTNWQSRAFFSRKVTVITEAQKSWAALTEQEIRWHTGGLFSPDMQTRLSYGFIMVYLTISVLAIPLCFALPLLWLVPGISFVTMSLMAVITGALTRQPVRTYWLLLVPFILLSMVYNSYLTIRALLRPVLVWKGTKLEF